MAEDRFSRFKNLEKERTSEPAAPSGASTGRFQALGPGQGAPDHPPEPVPPTAVTAERFTAPPASSPAAPRSLAEAQQAFSSASGLELAESRPGDQPFIRCCRCERDNHALAVTCACGASLNTLEQSAYNERVWRELQEKAAAPLPSHEPLPPAGQPVPAPPASPAYAGKESSLSPEQQRALGEAIARDLSRRSARGLGMGSAFGSGVEGPSVTEWLLTRASPRVRHGILAALVAVPALLMLLRATRPLGIALFLLSGVFLVQARFWRP